MPLWKVVAMFSHHLRQHVVKLSQRRLTLPRSWLYSGFRQIYRSKNKREKRSIILLSQMSIIDRRWLTYFCTQRNAACWSTVSRILSQGAVFPQQSRCLHKPAFNAPPSLTFSPGRNPNTPSRYWMVTATTPPPASRTKSLPLNMDALNSTYPPLANKKKR